MRETSDWHQEDSYGMIGISRHSGGFDALFGTDLYQDSVICLTIKQGEVLREHHSERYNGRQILAQVYLIPLQFSELMTTMNVSDGVPCTIRARIDKGWIQHKAPEKTKRQIVNKELEDKFKKAGQGLSALISEIKDLPMPKKHKDAFYSKARMVWQDLVLNLPFLKTQFDEGMDRVEHDAKSAVEAFVMHRVIEAGLAEVMKNPIQLEQQEHEILELESILEMDE